MATIIKVGQSWREKNASHGSKIYKISNIKDGYAYYIHASGFEETFGSLNQDGTAGWEPDWDLISEEDAVAPKAIQASMTVGCYCALCSDYASHASPNRPDGKTFLCYSCLQGWVPKGL